MQPAKEMQHDGVRAGSQQAGDKGGCEEGGGGEVVECGGVEVGVGEEEEGLWRGEPGAEFWAGEEGLHLCLGAQVAAGLGGEGLAEVVDGVVEEGLDLGETEVVVLFVFIVAIVVVGGVVRDGTSWPREDLAEAFDGDECSWGVFELLFQLGDAGFQF